MAAPTAHAATYSGGSGTEIDPYLISTPQDLLDLANTANEADWDKHFLMTKDINMTGLFTPIARDTDPGTYGFQGTKFTGVFDGGGHAVQNLTINLPTQDYVGLFGYISGASCQIKNLGMQGGTISGRLDVGGLVGWNDSGMVTSCYATGSISATGVEVILRVARVGGLVGFNDAGTVTACYATGAVTGGGNIVGGLIGISSGSVTACYATGGVTGDGTGVAGLVGSAVGSVTACYATGAVTGQDHVGGLVGGSNNNAPTASFWDMETSRQSGSGGGKGLTTAQMKTVAIFQNAGWAAYDWVMEDGQYPRLAWEGTGAPAIPSPEPVPLSGSGTEADPYLVQTAQDFALLSWYAAVLDADLLLTVDLDLTGGTLYPIGDLGTFTGVFDGGDHVITNVTIEQAER